MLTMTMEHAKRTADAPAHPLTQGERAFAGKLVACLQTRFWLHGGAAGLEVGELILPASETGATPMHPHREDYERGAVYFTHGLNDQIALAFADRVNGTVYEIEPLGEPLPDPKEFRAFLHVLETAPED